MGDRPALGIEDAVGLKQARDASERVRIGYAQFRNYMKRPGSEVAGRQPMNGGKRVSEAMALLRKG